MDFKRLGIDTGGRTGGKIKTYCPKCRDTRKNKRDKSLSVNLDEGIAHCHYCGENFNAKVTVKEMGYDRPKVAKQLPGRVWLPEPEHIGKTMLQEHVEWFANERNISTHTLEALGVTSTQEYMMQTGQKEACVCFNYFENGRYVNTKYRDLKKNFKMVSGAETIPYHIDGIYGQPECIITEGEIDALSFAEIGRTDVISVPAGANSNLTWMDRFVESHFEDKRVVYIAVDTDPKGIMLREELLRRLGDERCRVLTYPPECKDANEVLVKHGPEALAQALAQAPEIPLSGVFTVKDVSEGLRSLFENGMECGAETGWANFDEYCTFETGRLCVVTGIPGTGKSEFVDELVVRLNLRHGWKAAYFSPENMPLEYHLRKIMEKVTGARFKEGVMPESLYAKAERYMEENICSILPEENYTAEVILGKARELVRRKGIKVLVIDPFNRLEHQIPAGQTETQYISAFLDKLTNFAQRNRCLVVLVAHPRKMNREPGIKKDPVPTLYDINGSAAFFNKCDFGLTVERDKEAGITRIHIQKVKFRHLGTTGEAAFVFNLINSRYMEYDVEEGGSLPQREAGLFDGEPWV